MEYNTNKLSGCVVKKFQMFLTVLLSWRIIPCNNVLQHVSKDYRAKCSLQVNDTDRR